MFESIQLATKKASSSAEEYMEMTKEYVELKVLQQTSKSFAMLVKTIVIGGFFLFGALILLVAGILVWGEYLGNVKLSLLYTGLILFAMGLLIFMFRKTLVDAKVIKMMSNSFSK